MINYDEFKGILSKMLRMDIEDEGEQLVVRIESKNFFLTKQYFLELIENLSKSNTDDETLIYNENYFEVLARGENYYPSKLRYNENIRKEDTANKIIYEYESCSNEYILFIINKIYEAGLTNEFRKMGRNSTYMLSRRIYEVENDNLIDLIRMIFPRFETVRVRSESARTKNEYERLCNSFLFQMGFNLNYAVIEIRFLDEFFRTNRLMRLRRASLEEMEAPKRKYTSDLIYHYQLALSAESPTLQFLSYYHVMEHFFEKIYTEEIVKLVAQEITNPNFSPKRERDIKKLMNLISKKIKERGENYSFNEKEALTLTLAKYINLENLKMNLNEYDQKLEGIYKNQEVSFSNGDKVNFDQSTENTLAKLASRIYKTRNSIVHSKEGEKSKFMPFKDDKYLVNEIPLMRFLAEDIIIGDSTLI